MGLMQVTAPGFAYLTRCMVNLAEEVCNGKLLVTLEGGYNLNGQRDGTMAVLSELCGQPLDTGHVVNLGDEYAVELGRATVQHPAIEQAMSVAKRAWKL